MKVLLSRAEDPIHSLQKDDREIEPHFLLIMNFPNYIHDVNYRNMVIWFLFAGIGGVNTVESVFRCMDRPIVHSGYLSNFYLI